MIVSISGKPGSGKSTIAERLAKALGVPRYYIGGLRRKMAADRGLTLEQLNALGERDDWTDRDVDEYQRELGRQELSFVIEGRTSFHFIPHSFKVFLDVEAVEGARRIFATFERGERPPEAANVRTLEDCEAMLARRIASDVKRYQQHYGIEDIYDRRHYDFVLDTTGLPPDQVFERVLDAVRLQQKQSQ
ncbi:MAG: cytidylate kinase family protein [Candidatus Kerfeldbacteria bacterium]|nr:cytidylate kinase family protein [Candidatus Kerfeldbacteria bacterium]